MNARLLLVSGILCTLLVEGTVIAATPPRPGASQLFPGDAVAYLQVEDATALKESFGESSLGRMLEDPGLRPLVDELYGMAGQLFEGVGSRLGVSLEELLSIPQGEVAVGVLPLAASKASEASEEGKPRDESPEAIRRRLQQRSRAENTFGYIAVIEVGEQAGVTERLLERLGDQLREARYVYREAEYEEISIDRYAPPSADGLEIDFCLRDGTVLIGVGEGLVESMLARWDGKDVGPTLAQDADFAAAIGPCIGAQAIAPQITFFVDPYEWIRRGVKASGGPPALVWPVLEELGAARLRGIAGSSTSGGEFFESLVHVHVLIETPRDGLLSVVRPAEGDINPPAWVPSDVMSYTTIHWDLPATYAGLGRILDRFQGEDALERLAEKPLKDRFDVDLRQEVIEQLSGRVTITRWYERPPRINSQTQLWGLQVNDPAAAAATLEKFAQAFPGQVQKENEGSTVVYTGRGPGANFPPNFRRPTPCMAIVGDHLLLSDSREFLRRAIRAEGGALPRLAGLPEYDLVAAEVGGLLGEEKPFLFNYLRADEMLRQFYELAAAPSTQASLKQAGQNNPMLAKLSEAFEANGLPPYDTLTKYFAPSGGFAYNASTGIHYTSFSIKSP